MIIFEIKDALKRLMKLSFVVRTLSRLNCLNVFSLSTNLSIMIYQCRLADVMLQIINSWRSVGRD